jgi:hypothetical protein
MPWGKPAKPVPQRTSITPRAIDQLVLDDRGGAVACHRCSEWRGRGQACLRCERFTPEGELIAS